MPEQTDIEDAELPEISDIEHAATRSTARFENGAKLVYVEKHDGIHERVFAPSDSDSAMEDTFITAHADTTGNVLNESLDMYDGYDTVAQLRQDWESLAEWITHE